MNYFHSMLQVRSAGGWTAPLSFLKPSNLKQSLHQPPSLGKSRPFNVVRTRFPKRVFPSWFISRPL